MLAATVLSGADACWAVGVTVAGAGSGGVGAAVEAAGPMFECWPSSAKGSTQPISTLSAPTLSRPVTAPSASNLGRGVRMAGVASLARMMLCANLLDWAEFDGGAGLASCADEFSSDEGTVGAAAGSCAGWGGTSWGGACGGVGSMLGVKARSTNWRGANSIGFERSKAVKCGSSSSVGSIGRPDPVGSSARGETSGGRSANTGSRLKPSVGNCNGAGTGAGLADSGC